MVTKNEIIIEGDDLLRSLRIGIRMPRLFGIRMTVATWLFNLAGWISGTNVVVEIDNEAPEA